tara:strand:- start:433 stop:1188 length:756 start_codon:yes stop_codon:yes gene_type:complete
MFDKIKKYFSNKKEEKAILNSPIHVVAINAGLKANKELGLEKMADKIANMQSDYIMQKVHDIAHAEDAFIALRKQIVEVILELCSNEILCVDNKNKNDPTGLLNHPGISGELHKHIVKIFKVDKNFKEKLHGIKTTEKIDDKFLKSLVSGYYRHAAWKYEVINAIRLHLKDFNSNLEKDWVHPFRYCMSVFYENSYREKLKLKLLISPLNNIQYSTFTNFVLNGHKYPDLEFRESHKASIKNKSLYFPEKW